MLLLLLLMMMMMMMMMMVVVVVMTTTMIMMIIMTTMMILFWDLHTCSTRKKWTSQAVGQQHNNNTPATYVLEVRRAIAQLFLVNCAGRELLHLRLWFPNPSTERDDSYGAPFAEITDGAPK